MSWLLDTVVISELRKGPKCDAAVLAWQASTAGQRTFISVITLNEIWFGIESVKSRDARFASALREWYEGSLIPSFQGSFLPVGRQVAEIADELRCSQALSFNDALIAASASVHGLTLATRNEADFAETRIAVINPWRFVT